NDELHRLQGHMIEGLGFDNDDTAFKTQKSGHHYFKIKLTFRKTNQGDATKCKLLKWLAYLRQLGHPLRNEDYVFPTLGARGDVRLHQKVSPDTIQRYLD
ncbi:hypothetical protein BGX21_007528, partial [Mortierella sp. AD011]